MNLLLKEVCHSPMLWLLAFVPVVFVAGEGYRPGQGALPEMRNRLRGPGRRDDDRTQHSLYYMPIQVAPGRA